MKNSCWNSTGITRRANPWKARADGQRDFAGRLISLRACRPERTRDSPRAANSRIHRQTKISSGHRRKLLGIVSVSWRDASAETLRVQHAPRGVVADTGGPSATETTATPKRETFTTHPPARPLFHDFPAAPRIIALTVTCRLRCELSKLIARVIAFSVGFPRRIKEDTKEED